VDKDPTLAVPVLQGLLKYWPVTNSGKEMLFLNELEELLELTQQEEFKQILGALFRQLSRAIGSPHFQVAERALFLWHNDYISGLIADNRRDILPIIYPVLHVNSESHWNLTVKNLTYNVLKIFMELDTPLVEQCSKAYVAKKGKDDVRNAQKLEYWTKLGADIKDKSAWLLAADKRSAKLDRESKYSESSSSSYSSTSSPVSSNSIDSLTASFSSLSADDTEPTGGSGGSGTSASADGEIAPGSSTQDGASHETNSVGTDSTTVSSTPPTTPPKDLTPSSPSSGVGSTVTGVSSSTTGDVSPQTVLAG